ncbi:uncharacterized protein B0H18DRAFT_1212482 [Fomitopsis serialis]|uniref:uncharacterized protein n=1 Tax=Fomitopsis serialis TaxID=139415 RepID=UPI002008E775|nr:uncharacterized protein B0H18DRAFT_1212482 [Neoantrodia serialis]KAH9922602.1 hypothetical protein B0H18DRAFT_1212482 [Neoantrodia serialis]
MASEDTIYTPISEESTSRETCTKNNPWGAPLVQAARFQSPSTPSSSASSSSLTLDEDDVDATPCKAISHSEWLQQFAEQARRAHMRNISRPSFNLDASPFVPTAFRPLDLDDDDAYPDYDVSYEVPERGLLQVKQPWLSAFRRGCVTVDPKARLIHAQNVVAFGTWDIDSLAELANKVVDRVSEAYDEELGVLAPFARDLADYLAADVGQAVAEQFKDLLRECILTEFAVWWHMDFPTSVATLRYEFFRDAYRLFDIAFAVASFVGDAFAHALLPARAVHHCLALLVRKLSIIEQVQAVHAIVSHADARLYDGRTLLLLISVFKFRAERVPGGTSVLGEPFWEEDVRVFVKEIDALVDGWVKAGPSSKNDAERAPGAFPAPGPSQEAPDPSDEVIPTHTPTKKTRPAPLSYSDVVKKRKKT